MKALRRIALTELQVMFYSPIAWFILIIFLFQVVMAFNSGFEGRVAAQDMGRDLYALTSGIYMNPMFGFFKKLLSYLYLYIPLLTMGIMSRELSSGSIKLLYSSPVTNFQIIFGKYIAVVVYAFLMTFVIGMFVIYGACTIENFDWAPCLVALLGLFLLICAYGAIGLFMSSLTSYQVVAAVGSFAILAVLNIVGGMWQDIAFVRDIMFWLSIGGRSSEFIVGLLCSEDVIYFLTVIAMFLGFTVVRMKGIREKKSFIKTFAMHLSVVVIAVMIGYISSRPTMMGFYDATRFESNTLTPNSRKIVEQLDGGLTITTYANILDEDQYLWYGMPKNELRDLQRFKQYTRFKPELKINYVRYYAKGNNEEQLNKRYPHLSDRERMVKVATNYGVDTTIYLDLEQVSKLEDLSGEAYRFVRSIERENGQKTFLRIYNDMYVHPFESEISAALKRLVMKLPQVGFVEGHGERNCVKMGDRDYGIFAQDKWFRNSLINQGFDFRQINLDQPIPEDITIVVISEMRHAMTPEQEKNLDDYVARGGNILIAGEAKRQDVMNPLLAKFGVSLLPGCLVCPTDNYPHNLIIARPTAEAKDFSFYLAKMVAYKYVAAMPSATGLDISGVKEKGFEPTVLFVNDTTKGKHQIWSEVETTDFIDDTARINPAVGEKLLENIPMMVALSRKVGDKEQKIMILADADCLSNAELSRSRKGINATNFSLITSSFFWMSDGEAPVDIRRPESIDRKIFVTPTGLVVTKVVFMGVLPILMMLFAILMWVRRKGR